MRLTLKNNVMYLPNAEEICDVSLDLIRAAPDMLVLLTELSDVPDTKETPGAWTCRWCGMEYSAMMGDADVPDVCPNDDCAGHEARELVARASGVSALRREAIFMTQDKEFAAKLVACVDEVTLNLLVKGEET